MSRDSVYGRGSSGWMKAARSSEYPRLKGDQTVDVAIIGGGITGLTAAYHLKRAGKTVAVLERFTVGSGTTGYTTGKVSSQHGVVYKDLIKQVGEQKTRAYGQANEAAITDIEQIIKRERIDCDWTREDNFVFTEQQKQVESLQQEAAAAGSLGLPASFVRNVPLPYPTAGGMKFTGQAKFHARRYVHGLARAVDGDGSHVYEDSTVTSYADGSPCRVKTKDGTITATDIILTTLVPYKISTRTVYGWFEYPKQSYIIAAKLKGPLPAGMYITPGSPLRSLLPVTIDGEELLLVGGESHLPYAGGRRGKRYRRLEEYARSHFEVESIAHRWLTRDYVSIDHLPFVGKLYRRSKHLFVGTAFMKWGLTNGTVVGKILADRITGTENQYAAVFDTRRMTPWYWLWTMRRKL